MGWHPADAEDPSIFFLPCPVNSTGCSYNTIQVLGGGGGCVLVPFRKKNTDPAYKEGWEMEVDTQKKTELSSWTGNSWRQHSYKSGMERIRIRKEKLQRYLVGKKQSIKRIWDKQDFGNQLLYW